MAQQLPQFGTVVSGQATIGAQTNNSMTVKQASQRAIINWNSFNVGAQSKVVFDQPDVTSSTLNRVTGSTTSTIAGQIISNGQVLLVNPNGILITKDGSVAAGGGFVASTLDIADKDFNDGSLKFRGNGRSASVVNQGAVATEAGGLVGLLGGSVSNSGTISSPRGKIAMGAGEVATLDLSGDGLLQIALPSQTTGSDALIANTGRVRASGGRIELKAATAREAARNAINLAGHVSASSARRAGGAIVLDGGAGGSVRVTGRVAARSKTAKGGSISIGGEKIALAGATIDARGATGGGAATIGGGARGRPVPGLTTAESVSIDKASSIDASATESGGGGGVTIWSNVLTDFAGSLAARSKGAETGGAAEVSGGTLIYAGSVNLLSEAGKAGSLLLDPYNLTISSAASSGVSGTNATATGSNLNASSLVSALSGANVTVATGSAGTESGNVTVNADLAWNAPTTLTLSAAGGIVLNNNISVQNNGGALTLKSAGATSGLTGAGSIVNEGVLTVNQTGATSYDGNISGAGKLIVQGTNGFLTATGALSYTGATRIDSGATLMASGSFGTNGVYAGDLTIDGTRFRYAGAGDLTLSGKITGTGSLNQNSTGTMTLSGVNTNSGIFYVNFGTVKVGSNTGLSSTARLHMSTVNSTVLDLNGYSPTIGLLTGAGKVTSSRSGAMTLNLGNDVNVTGFSASQSIEDGAGVIAVRKVGSNIQGLSGENTFSGGLTIDSGILTGGGAAVSVNFFGKGETTINANGKLEVNGSRDIAYDGLITLNGGEISNSLSSYGYLNADLRLTADSKLTGGSLGVSNVDLGASTLTLANANVYGVISGTGSVSGYGALYGQSTYTGATRATGGILQLARTARLGGGDYAGAITIDTGAEFHYGSSSAQTLRGAITGAGPLIKETSSSILTLAGANSFTGGMTATAGQINLTGTVDLGAGTLSTNVSSGATIGGTGVVTAASLSHTGAGALALTGANKIGSVTTTGTVGAFALSNAQSLTVNSIASTGAVRVLATGAQSDLTIASGAGVASSATGDAVALGAGRNFINLAGSGAASTPNGRWLVYSSAPTGNVYNDLDSGNTAIWNKTAGATVTDMGSRYVFAMAPTLTVTTTDVRKTYGDDVTSAVAAAYTVTGAQSGVMRAFRDDTIANVLSGALSITSAGSSAYASVAGSPYTIAAAQGSATTARGYGLQYVSSGRLTIDKAQISGVSFLAKNKAWDGTDKADYLSMTLTGRALGTDVNNLGVTADSVRFDNGLVGINKQVTATNFRLTGSAAANYDLLTKSATSTASIYLADPSRVSVAEAIPVGIADRVAAVQLPLRPTQLAQRCSGGDVGQTLAAGGKVELTGGSGGQSCQ